MVAVEVNTLLRVARSMARLFFAMLMLPLPPRQLFSLDYAADTISRDTLMTLRRYDDADAVVAAMRAAFLAQHGDA